ncbi:MAG: chromosome segregation protein SMC [Lachnospiraceae bacterium]|nr:chromosome segregation protein SMC [Lachnospiraceae bacterium]
MYLKSIEVQGFKSFANKILFEFHNGITGTVGPNGSGKSNVADAVRWVLGEQSAKQLRGSKMEDIIFSGTENRKPQGFAYVALTIDNADHQLAIDYDEVTVARRVYRSGESEYLLNGSPCRLKDVNELFYDTGIGKEGYSIIGQGQIDKILSGKPEERRELFDEAAGIVKFKRRKNEAVKKLEAERQNLVRVEDILSELEKQVGPLQKQAETAREYLRLKEELKTYDITMFLSETDRLRAQLSELEKKESDAAAQLEETKLAEGNAKEEYGKLEISLETKETELSSLREDISGTQMQKEKLEGEIRLLQEQIHHAVSQDEGFGQRIEALGKEQQEKQQEETQWKKENETMSMLLAKAKEELTEAEEVLHQVSGEIQDKSEAVDRARNRIIAVLNEKSNVRGRIQRYETMLEQIQIRKAELSRKLLQYKSTQSAQDETIEELEGNLSRLQKEIEGQEAQREKLEQRISKLHETNLELEVRRNDYQQKFHAEKSRLEALKNLTERYDGYGNSIRHVMELKASKKGIAGVVADIIKTEKKFETAIETALGGNIQNIVTDSEQTAKELIEYLKKNKFGRATFLPLNAISNRNPFHNDRALKEPGVLGLANGLVSVDEEYRKVADYLLGRVLVVDHIDHALSLARKYDYSLRIVTLEGELLNAGGSLTGGAFKNSGNLLGRRREIEELEAQTTKLWEAYNQAKTQIDTNRAENVENRAQLEQLKQLLQEKYLLQNTANVSLGHAKEEQESLLGEYRESAVESKEIENQASDIRASMSEQEQQIQALEEENTRLEADVAKWTEEIEEARKKEALQSAQTEKVRLNYAGYEQKMGFIRENTARIRKECEKLLTEVRALTDNRENSLADIEQKKAEIEDKRTVARKAAARQEELQTDLQTRTREKEELSAAQKDSLKKREELSAQISVLDKELFRLASQKEKLSDTLDASIHYMWDEYEMTASEAAAWKQERAEITAEIGELKKHTASLKNQIKALGSVNVNAIEDYKEVSERYEFLSTQHNDLKTAEETLMKIIEELDTGMRMQFQEKFEEIRVEFDKVFKELFGGGKGTLELIEDEDVLEAGIRIISQPPGKKLQNMMQLSGGEKALTAIALLFAIQNLKPSPFCLLDEIEAALDDSNVGRFAKYLHKLTKNTQFIVITHRRGTMSAADRLYGITMQEKGVSTLVSVNLIEAQLNDSPAKEEV